MRAWRLKHIPSGMYYCPSRSVLSTSVVDKEGKPSKLRYWVKSNLSKKGKAYLSKPTLKWLQHGFYDPRVCIVAHRYMTNRHNVAPLVESDWLLEEITNDEA